MAKLNFVLEDGQEIIVSVQGRVSLGRDEGNDVVVDYQRISAQHAVLVQRDNGEFEVRDLGSKAGTFVNEERVQRATLSDGDKLAFGPLTGVFRTNDAANGAGAAPARRASIPACESSSSNGKLSLEPAAPEVTIQPQPDQIA